MTRPIHALVLAGALAVMIAAGCATPKPRTAEPPAPPSPPAQDGIAIRSYQPDSPARLNTGEKFEVDVEYSLATAERALILVRPYSNGRQSAGYVAHPAEEQQRGRGRVKGWFLFHGPIHVDEVRATLVAVDGAEKRLLISCSNHVDVTWAAAPAGP